MHARMTATRTQNVWLANIAETQLCRLPPTGSSGMVAIVDLRFFPDPIIELRSYLFDGASDKSSNFLRRASGDALIGDFPAASEHNDAVRDREDVRHAVAD
jgi:hypothetical protein